MEQRLTIFSQIRKQCNHVLKVALCLDGFIDVVISRHESIFAIGIVHNLPLLHGFYKAMVNTQRHSIPFGKLRKDRLLLGRRRVLLNCPGTPVRISNQVAIRKELHNTRSDTVKEIFCADFFRINRGLFFYPLPAVFSFFLFLLGKVFHVFTSSKNCAPSTSGI